MDQLSTGKKNVIARTQKSITAHLDPDKHPKHPKALNQTIREHRREKYHGMGMTREQGNGASMRELKNRSKSK